MDPAPSATPEWKVIGHRKRQQRERCIRPEWRLNTSRLQGLTNLMHVPVECGILTKEEIHITSDYDAVDLIDKIREQTFSVEAVVTAFCKRAAIAHQLTNCLTEIFFEEAIITAREMDVKRKEQPDKPLPPLFGLPISVKDSFNIPGLDSSIGFVTLAEKPANTYAALLLLLKDLGAVLYCKTNIPQTLMTADSDNNIFGRTLNPHNTRLTAGGSSGGEGALVAMRGSVLGVGTDIAGSIRIPAACCGLYGFKPSTSIIPYSGQQSPSTPGIAGIAPCAGPIATSARACALFMKAVMEAEPWKYDIFCHRVHWIAQQPAPPKVLRIGYVEDLGTFTPTPPVRRALRESAEKLQKAGHDIIPVKLEGVAKVVEDCWQLYTLDGLEATIAFMEASGEPATPSVANIGFASYPPKSMTEFMALNYRRLVARQSYAKLWKEHSLDVMLVALAPHTAPPLDTWKVVDYTGLFNYLDWATAVLPVGKVDSSDTVDHNAKYGPLDEESYRMYTGPEDYAEAPLSIQIVGEPQGDQKLATILPIIDDAIRQHS